QLGQIVDVYRIKRRYRLSLFGFVITLYLVPPECNEVTDQAQLTTNTLMPEGAIKSSKRVLDPVERISEVLFGLIMVLTFTGSLSVAEAGRDDVRTMLICALGCE